MVKEYVLIVTVKVDETAGGWITAPGLCEEIQSGLEYLDESGITGISVREYTGRPWLLLGGVQE